jgi:hypothetical protein
MTITTDTPAGAVATDPRTAWCDDAERIVAVVRKYPAIPTPRIYPGLVAFWFTDISEPDVRSEAVHTAQRALTAAFRCEFTSGKRSDGWREFVTLTATLPASGLRVDLIALVVEIRPQDASELAGTVAA